MNNFTNTDLILVTGGSNGLGRAIALKLNALGARVVAVARNEERLKVLVMESSNPANMFYAVRDLSTDIETLSDFVKSLVQQYGRFSGFVHSAGVFKLEPISVFDYTDAISRFNTNYFSAIQIVRGLNMKKNRQDLLSIVFISSIASFCASPASMVYSATKAALCSTTKVLTRELGKQRIRINSILPGNTMTDMVIAQDNLTNGEFIKRSIATIPFGEIGKPEYVADLAAFLLSLESYWIQGQNIVIDGGEGL